MSIMSFFLCYIIAVDLGLTLQLNILVHVHFHESAQGVSKFFLRENVKDLG
jgi:hypothetical protein